ncbi:MAG TPA: hypothetical protein VG917_00225 [Patescibacteria group bacterium]|nr:hypothetical protein [Patescibacteria group bacterium]
MKIKILFLIIIFSLFLPSHAFAHVLKTDGTIGILMHVSPDDDPIAGQQSSFFFDLKDTTGKFKSQNCDCNISIIQDGKKISTQPLAIATDNQNLSSAGYYFTFPSRGIYQVEIDGKSTNNSFNKFKLTYDVRVDRVSQTNTNDQQTENNSTGNLPRIAFAAVIGFALIFLVLKLTKRKEVTDKNEKN